MHNPRVPEPPTENAGDGAQRRGEMPRDHSRPRSRPVEYGPDPSGTGTYGRLLVTCFGSPVVSGSVELVLGRHVRIYRDSPDPPHDAHEQSGQNFGA